MGAFYLHCPLPSLNSNSVTYVSFSLQFGFNKFVNRVLWVCHWWMSLTRNVQRSSVTGMVDKWNNLLFVYLCYPTEAVERLIIPWLMEQFYLFFMYFRHFPIFFFKLLPSWRFRKTSAPIFMLFHSWRLVVDKKKKPNVGFYLVSIHPNCLFNLVLNTRLFSSLRPFEIRSYFLVY